MDDFLNEMKIYYEFKVELIVEVDVTSSLWNETSKKYDGFLGIVQDKKVDVGLFLAVMTSRRVDYVDFSIPFKDDYYHLYAKVPDNTIIQWSLYSRVYYIKIIFYVYVYPNIKSRMPRDCRQTFRGILL